MFLIDTGIDLELSSESENWLEGSGLGALNPDKDKFLYLYLHTAMKQRVAQRCHGFLDICQLSTVVIVAATDKTCNAHHFGNELAADVRC